MRAIFRTMALLTFAGVTATTAVAQHPRLLKRHGVVYGVRDLDFDRNCKGYPPGDGCVTYRVTGTIRNLDANEHGVLGFDLRMAGGRTKYQNVPADIPDLFDRLLWDGRRVRVSGMITGQGRVATVDRITLVGR